MLDVVPVILDLSKQVEAQEPISLVKKLVIDKKAPPLGRGSQGTIHAVYSLNDNDCYPTNLAAKVEGQTIFQEAYFSPDYIKDLEPGVLYTAENTDPNQWPGEFSSTQRAAQCLREKSKWLENTMVSHYGFGVIDLEQRHLFYLMEKFGDGNLGKHSLYELGPEELENSMLSLRNIFLALQVLNKQGIPHRDIKPENLLISLTNGEIKITDFNPSLIDDPEKTQAFGSPAYVAPEAVAAAQADIVEYTSDTFSMFAVLAKLAVGNGKTVTHARGNNVTNMIHTVLNLPEDAADLHEDYRKILFEQLTRRYQDLGIEPASNLMHQVHIFTTVLEIGLTKDVNLRHYNNISAYYIATEILKGLIYPGITNPLAIALGEYMVNSQVQTEDLYDQIRQANTQQPNIISLIVNAQQLVNDTNNTNLIEQLRTRHDGMSRYAANPDYKSRDANQTMTVNVVAV